MEEQWKDIAGYEGLYEVSNLGFVRNKRKVLRPAKSNRGYLMVLLSKNGKQKCFLVHRLVASTFCGVKEGCDIVNHIDNNPMNNTAPNLEWVTQKANVHHAARVGAKVIRPVVRSDGQNEVHYPSLCATQADGFNKAQVCLCCQGKVKSHKGYSWRYANEEPK